MNYFTLALLAVLLITATITDVRSRKIPNWLTFSAMTAAVLHYSMSSGFEGLCFGIFGLISGMSVFIIIYLLGGMGAGDVKLMGAVGAILGPQDVISAMFLTVVAGGIYAAFVLAFTKHLKIITGNFFSRSSFFPNGRLFKKLYTARHEKKPILHYGLAIAIGTSISVVLAKSGYQLFQI
ncbi:MAG: prepilin peptidase [Syntrophales bacterium]|jgi:prepilin peptidase CpaA|nr:prepilin peptidase [Syntrophales bacterium]MDY0044758.1 prepilin peptidase [Syntrophales bacterium]